MKNNKPSMIHLEKYPDETVKEIIEDARKAQERRRKMSKLLKVTLQFDDKIMSIEGEEVEKWQSHCHSLETLASVHGMNPFDSDPIHWNPGKAEKS